MVPSVGVAQAHGDRQVVAHALMEVVHQPFCTDHTVHLTPRTMDLRAH